MEGLPLPWRSFKAWHQPQLPSNWQKQQWLSVSGIGSDRLPPSPFWLLEMVRYWKQKWSQNFGLFLTIFDRFLDEMWIMIIPQMSRYPQTQKIKFPAKYICWGKKGNWWWWTCNDKCYLGKQNADLSDIF